MWKEVVKATIVIGRQETKYREWKSEAKKSSFTWESYEFFTYKGYEFGLQHNGKYKVLNTLM